MIGLGSDHGGYDLKQVLMERLQEEGIEFKDYGCYYKKSCDYPTYARAVARAVLSGECEKGILICTTGIGISIAANRLKGIRAALCTDSYMAKMTRLHNNANILALGANVLGPGAAVDIMDTFLATEFSGDERHVRRVRAIEDV